MNIRDIIYYSPNVKMEALDFNNRELLLNAFLDRIENYYFLPIKQLNGLRYAFAAGILLLSLIDAFARYSTRIDDPGPRIKEWVKHNLNLGMYNKIEKEKIARVIYKDFRCGLLHESHIKNCGQFSYEIGSAVYLERDFVIINPSLLFKEIESYFQQFIDDLAVNEELYNIFLDRMRGDFEEEQKGFKMRDNHKRKGKGQRNSLKRSTT